MISVWLKVRDRGNMDFLLKHLYYWIGVFSDTTKYKIYLYNENVILPEDIKNYDLTIINRQMLMSDPDCCELNQIIQPSSITPNWRGACFALSSPYWYLKDNNPVINIDADDIITYGHIRSYIEMALERIQQSNLPTLSFDMSYSAHYWDQLRLHPNRPHHWTFGINVAKRQEMKAIITSCLRAKSPPSMPWGVNIDYLLDYYFEANHSIQFICFDAPVRLVHAEAFYHKLGEDRSTVEVSVNDRPFRWRKSDRTVAF